jgi:hypothetical protein
MMKKRTAQALNFKGLTTFKMIGVVLLAGSLLSVWPGCKDGSTDSASAPSRDGTLRPIALEAQPLRSAQHAMGNPLRVATWKNAQWFKLAASQSGSSVTAQTEIAAAFTPADLYIAIVATGPYHGAPKAAADQLWRHDCSEIWLDTSRRQNGTNFFELVVSPSGRTHGVWHRSSTSPTPTSSGAPDLNHPYGLIPWTIRGLVVKTGSGLWRNRRAMTTVVKIPVAGLPRPLRFISKTGGRFRINVLRYIWQARANGHRKLTQYSLFPVPPELQAYAPYLMGRLALISSNDANLALRQ